MGHSYIEYILISRDVKKTTNIYNKNMVQKGNRAEVLVEDLESLLEGSADSSRVLRDAGKKAVIFCCFCWPFSVTSIRRLSIYNYNGCSKFSSRLVYYSVYSMKVSNAVSCVIGCNQTSGRGGKGPLSSDCMNVEININFGYVV